MRSSWSCGSGRGAPRPPPWGEARWRGAVVGVGRAAGSARRVSGGRRGRRILDSKARLQEWEEEQLGGIGATGGGGAQAVEEELVRWQCSARRQREWEEELSHESMERSGAMAGGGGGK
jgi:hypothetical protein